MPLRLVRAPDAGALWDTCADRFLQAIGEHPGPGFAAHLWVAQESQATLLYERAAQRSLPGWLDPPVTTLRTLPARFGLRHRCVGLLTRRRLVARAATEAARQHGLADPTHMGGVARGHMLDSLFGELLPEGVTPDRLAAALADLGGDDFARRRNAWMATAYRAYREELARRERIDQRENGALVAEAIEAGQLADAFRGVTQLHVFGLYTPRSRERLLRALDRQGAVDVALYVLAHPADEPGADEWVAFTEQEERIDSGRAPTVAVQPAPDVQREVEWIAREVKRLLVDNDIEPHRIAVVARSGHEDTGRVQRALADAGVTATTIVRARLSEIAALRALMLLFRGAARDWSYRTLRPVLDHTYFDTGIDLRNIDFIAATRRVAGLEEWQTRLEWALDLVRKKDRTTWGRGLRADSLRRDIERFAAIRPILEALSESRTEADWIRTTLNLVQGADEADLGMRKRVCNPHGERWDVVRLDQRGLRHTERMLREWLDMDPPARRLTPGEWLTLLARLLEANELSLWTPVHQGVQVLEAHDAALFPVEHTFVMHANDGVFPRAFAPGGVLSARERTALRESGIPLSNRQLDQARERALWRAIGSSGEVRISYRTADPSGTPLLPSLMVPAHDETAELPRTREPQRDARFAPITTPQATRLAAIALRESRAGNAVPELAGADPELLRHAVVGAVAEQHRDSGAEPVDQEHVAMAPNPWNGWVRDPVVLDRLAHKYGDDYVWSASALEKYSTCPFVFLVERVFGIQEVAEAEDDVTPLTFGSATHQLLEEFYSSLGGDLPREFDARAKTKLDAAAAAVIARLRQADEWLGDETLWESAWRGIRRGVEDFVRWELGQIVKTGVTPERFEYEFGVDEHAWITGKDVAGRSAKLRIRGQIDRVDRVGGFGDGPLEVLDYKRNWVPTGPMFSDGTALQAVLYLQALENEGNSVSTGRYRAVNKIRNGGTVTRDSDNYAASIAFALTIPARIRDGLFEPVSSWKNGDWKSYWPGPEIARSSARLMERNRFEDVEPNAPAPVQPPSRPVDDSVSAALRLPFDGDHG